MKLDNYITNGIAILIYLKRKIKKIMKAKIIIYWNKNIKI